MDLQMQCLGTMVSHRETYFQIKTRNEASQNCVLCQLWMMQRGSETYLSTDLMALSTQMLAFIPITRQSYNNDRKQVSFCGD